MSESVEFRCPHCGQMYRLAAEQLARRAGKLSTCRKCQQTFAFPALPSEEEAATEVQTEYEQPYQPEPFVPEPAPQEMIDMQPPAAEAPASSAARPSARAAARKRAAADGGFFARGNMIAPLAAPVLFWVLAALVVARGGYGLWLVTRQMNGLLLVESLVWLLVGPVVIRVLCEALVVIFRIHDDLRQISHKTPE